MTPQLRDVLTFQRQLGHAYEVGAPRLPDLHLTLFRLRFLGEELRELGEALGVEVEVNVRAPADVTAVPRSLARALDALVDLDYVSLGTTLQLGLGDVYAPAWDLVHAANLRKVAGKKATRGYVKDAVKPADWQAPDLRHLVGETEG